MLCNYLVRTLQYFQKFLNSLFCRQKVEKKTPKKVAQKNSNPLFFPLLSLLPKRPKQKNSCFKMWLLDQRYIELGIKPRKRDPPILRSSLLHTYLIQIQGPDRNNTNFQEDDFSRLSAISPFFLFHSFYCFLTLRNSKTYLFFC